MAFLVALGVFVAVVVVGVVLFTTGHIVFGFVAVLASVPFALATWMKWGDRGSERPAARRVSERPRASTGR
jgi:hypothetical protein